MAKLFNKKKEKKKADSDILDLITADDKATIVLINKRYQAGINYLRSQGYYDTWPEYDRFWNSDQWPQITKKTKKYPRPVTNYFASIIEQKVSSITYDMPKIYFDPVDTVKQDRVTMYNMMGVDEGPSDVDAAEALSFMAEHQWQKLNMEDKIDIICRDSALMGTGIGFFPWDNTITGGSAEAPYIGDIAGYEIDPADLIVGNPSNPDIQSQPYIIMAERVPLAEAKETYKEAGDILDLLQPETRSGDREIYDQQQVEMDMVDYVDIIHCWEKVPLEGREPTPSEEVREDGAEDEKDFELEETLSEELALQHLRLQYTAICQNIVLKHEPVLYKHGKYPFIAFPWGPKRKSFYGKPESVDLINNQKEINRLSGISLIGIYQTGLPNTIIKTGFVEKEQVPVGPGGAIIEDGSPPGSRGIEYMQPPQFAPNLPQTKASIIEGMKDAAGVHEAWTGKQEGSQLNASAIIALQEAAGIRIRGIQRRLRKAIKELAEIWLAHWKEFVEEDRFIKIISEKRVKGYFWFNGTNYRDMEFDIRAQAGSASPFSRSLLTAQLDKMHERQIITSEEYLDCLPNDIFPEGDKILQKRFELQEIERKQQEEQKRNLIQSMIQDMIQHAKATGVPITPEALSQMVEMVKDIAYSSMEELAERQAASAKGGGKGRGGLPSPDNPMAHMTPNVGGDFRGQVEAELGAE